MEILKKIFLIISLIIVVFQIQGQEIAFSVTGDNCINPINKNEICFRIENNSKMDYYINTTSLIYFVDLTDSLGNAVHRKYMYYPENWPLREYVNVKKGDCIELYVETTFFEQFEYQKGMIYYYKPTYYCSKRYKKKRSKIKTLTGVHSIKPYKFKICE